MSYVISTRHETEREKIRVVCFLRLPERDDDWQANGMQVNGPIETEEDAKNPVASSAFLSLPANERFRIRHLRKKSEGKKERVVRSSNCEDGEKKKK